MANSQRLNLKLFLINYINYIVHNPLINIIIFKNVYINLLYLLLNNNQINMIKLLKLFKNINTI